MWPFLDAATTSLLENQNEKESEMGKSVSIYFFVVVVGLASIQAQQTGAATASGTCNIAISGNNNTLPSATLLSNRCGLSTEQVLQIVKLLNTVFTKRDAAQISAKLDELIELASKPSQTQNCVGSNCVQGTNYGSQTYNQYGPVPRVMSDENLQAFSDALKASMGSLGIVKASTAEDVEPLAEQLRDAAHNAQWGIIVIGAMSADARVPLAEGIQCYAPDWNRPDAIAFLSAMSAGHLVCDEKLPGSYEWQGSIINGGGITVVIGRPISKK
jgi:hypothetical protein